MNFGCLVNSNFFYRELENKIEIINTSKDIIAKIDYLSILNEKEINRIFHLLLIIHFKNKIYYIIYSKTEDNQDILLKSAIYDISIKKQFEINLPKEQYAPFISKISLKDYTYAFDINKIFILGGRLQDNIHIQKSVYSFDIGTYIFQKEKFSEFTLIPRYKGAALAYNGMIYILGGISSIKEHDDNINEAVQFGKYDINKLHKFNTGKIEGEKPKMMVYPNILFVNERFIVAFSGYKYCKLWILDTKNSKGKNFDLRKLKIDNCNSVDTKFLLSSCNFESDTKAVIELCEFKQRENDYDINIISRTIEF